MKTSLRVLSFVSRIPALLFGFTALIFLVSFVGGLAGQPGPLNIAHYHVATNTLAGILVSSFGAVISGFLVWLFAIQIPYLCLRKLPLGRLY